MVQTNIISIEFSLSNPSISKYDLCSCLESYFTVIFLSDICAFPPHPQGVIEDRVGFFPAAFAHVVRAGDQVFRCNRTFIGCKEQGQITLKEGQVLRSDLSVPGKKGHANT